MRTIICYLAYIIILILLVLGNRCLNAQSTSVIDTTQINLLLQKGKAFKYKVEYDSAKVYYQQAADQYQALVAEGSTTYWEAYIKAVIETANCLLQNAKPQPALDKLLPLETQTIEILGNRHPLSASILHHIGFAYFRKGANKEASDYAQKALDTRLEVLENNHPDLADSYYLMGVIQSFYGEPALAIDYLDKSTAIFELPANEDHPRVTTCYIDKSSAYRQLGDYEKALENSHKALKIRRKIHGDTHQRVGVALAGLGNIYLNLGHYDRALDYYAQTKDIFGDTHPSIGGVYANMGAVYYEQGRVYEALDYFQKGLNDLEKRYGHLNPGFSGLYAGIATMFRETQQYELAHQYHDFTLQTALKKTEDKRSLASVYNDIGLTYREQQQFSLATDYYQKALTIQQQLPETYVTGIGNTYTHLGNLNLVQGQKDTALDFFKKANLLRKEQLDVTNTLVVSSLYDLARANHALHKEEVSLDLLQKALQGIAQDFTGTAFSENPTLEAAIEEQQLLLNCLTLKGTILLQLYKEQPTQINYLTAAYQTGTLACQFIEQFGKSYKRSEDQQYILQYFYPTYELGIQAALKMANLKSEDQYVREAFMLAEKSKAILLRANFQETYARSFADIPTEMVEKEQATSVYLTFYEQQLKEALLKEQIDSSKITLWKDKIFTLKQTQDSITTYLETTFPKYYQLKYATSTASIENIQALLPNQQAALIEYFVGDSTIIAFVVDKESIKAVNLKREFDLAKSIQQLRMGLTNYHLTNQASDSLYATAIDRYTQNAFLLYQKLIAPLGKLPKQLMIVPDGLLNYIPFDALLTTLPTEAHRFAAHDFLIKQHQISYNYAATLWQDMTNLKVDGTQLLAIAPSFKPTEGLASTGEPVRRELNPLKYNITEAEAITTTWGGTAWTAEAASLINFKEQANQYQLLHLATHAILDDRDATFSYLTFATTADSLANNKLFIRDLYNLNLPTKMVVLSACETGVGPLKRGEGLLSLSKGFAYAGAKSIFSSLWSVNDRVSNQIMTAFYTQLKDGQAKDVALRQAKLDYLTQSNHRQSHPFFWAAFIPVGDMQPIKRGGISGWTFWAIGLGVGIALFAVFSTLAFRRRQPDD